MVRNIENCPDFYLHWKEQTMHDIAVIDRYRDITQIKSKELEH